MSDIFGTIIYLFLITKSKTLYMINEIINLLHISCLFTIIMISHIHVLLDIDH